MLKNLGRLVWSHTRDMNVFNYPKAIVYEIRTSDGDILVKFCKDKEIWSIDKRRNGDFTQMFKSPSPSGRLDSIEPSAH